MDAKIGVTEARLVRVKNGRIRVVPDLDQNTVARASPGTNPG